MPSIRVLWPLQTVPPHQWRLEASNMLPMLLSSQERVGGGEGGGVVRRLYHGT